MSNLSRRDVLKAAAAGAVLAGTPAAAESAFGPSRADPDKTTFDIALEGGGIKGIAFAGAVGELLRRKHEPRRVIGTSAGAIFACCLAAGYDADGIAGLLAERDAGKRLRFGTFLEPLKDPTAPPEFPKGAWLALQAGVATAFAGLEKYRKKNPDSADKLERLEQYLRWGLALLATGGAADDQEFLAWMRERLKAKKLKPDVTLSDFDKQARVNGMQLSLIATDLTAQQLLVLNHHTAPDLPVVQAVRMSMGIPLVWREVEWKEGWGTYRGQKMREGGEGHRVVDGGVLSNFPLRFLLDEAHSKPEGLLGSPPDGRKPRNLGLLLDETKEPPSPIASRKKDRYSERLPVYQVTSRLIDTMTSAWDKEAIEGRGAEGLICRIGVKGVDTLDFDMTDKQIEALVESGRKAMAEYLDSARP